MKRSTSHWKTKKRANLRAQAPNSWRESAALGAMLHISECLNSFPVLHLGNKPPAHLFPVQRLLVFRVGVGVTWQNNETGGKTMKNRLVYVVTCGVCFALLGCASEQRRLTGFLGDYSILKPHPTIQDALVYWNPRIDRKQYKAVLVEPVEVHFMRRGDVSHAKPEEVEAFRRFVTDELTKAISKHAAIATEPGANVLRCRLQIANLQFTRQIGEQPYHCLPPDYALGTANIETDAHDSITGELVVAYVSPRSRAEIYTPPVLFVTPDRWEAARTMIQNRIETWTDLAARHFVSGESGTETVSSPHDFPQALLLPHTSSTPLSVTERVHQWLRLSVPCSCALQTVQEES